jgi:hypothetical protein
VTALAPVTYIDAIGPRGKVYSNRPGQYGNYSVEVSGINISIISFHRFTVLQVTGGLQVQNQSLAAAGKSAKHTRIVAVPILA